MQLTFETPLDTLTAYLRHQGWIENLDEVVMLEKPGEGNMNMVVRVITQQSSLILKQANSYVQKYPSIPAPTERIKVEYLFYHLLQDTKAIQGFLPQLLGFDASNHLLAVQDLGHSADFLFLYQSGVTLEESSLLSITDFLSLLHGIAFEDNIILDFPSNLALRTLNHQHLFVYPFMEDNGFNLDQIQLGLQNLSRTYKTDTELKKHLHELGQLYLSTGKTLLHGDYYPGSWLNSPAGFKVIDPEFCYFGNAAYDLGILIAHLKMGKMAASAVDSVLKRYQFTANLDEKLTFQFAGMEILRRIIGLAQLPLDLSLEEKSNLLEEARSMVLQG